jgi:serine/threonine protein kinase
MSSSSKINSYRIIEKIAEGGMAEVFLAQSQGVGQVSKYVAIKRVLAQFKNNHELISMFKDEAQISIQLRHPNIVSVYDFGVDKDQHYLVMEYVPGKTLAQFRQELFNKQINLPVEYSLYIIREIASALSYAHNFKDLQTGNELNLIHRDLSPHNILIGFDGSVKIIDFGVAKSDMSENKTTFGTIKGKLGYLSPEQAFYKPVDYRSDQFSLGIIFWELLACQRLFNCQNQDIYFEQLRDFKMPDPSVISKKAEPIVLELLNQMLSKDVSFRYSSTKKIYSELNYHLNRNYPEFSAETFSNFILTHLPEWHSFERKYQNFLFQGDEKTQLVDSRAGLEKLVRIKHSFKVIQG